MQGFGGKYYPQGLEIFTQTERLDLAEAYKPGYIFAPQNGNNITDAMYGDVNGGVTEKRQTKYIL